MANPLFCSGNFLNTVMYPDHAVSALEEPSGNEAFRAGTGRRSSLNAATSATANAAWWLKVRCDRVRMADFVALDRGHNLAGRQVKVQGSNDNFTTTDTIVDVTVPASVYAPSDLREDPGTLTEEGAWLRRFTPRAYRDWRLYVPAMGAGLRPLVVGLYVDLSWEPAFLQALPFAPHGRRLSFTEVESDTAWVGASRAAQRYETTINLQLQDWAEYDVARIHIETQAWRRRPTWYVPDQAKAERAWLGQVPAGTYRFEEAGGWGFMQTSFPLVETAPKLI